MFRKPSLFLSSGKAPLPGGPLRLGCSQSLGTIEAVNFFRYAPENRSSPRVVTGKWLLKRD
jgi:hypothetical protein